MFYDFLTSNFGGLIAAGRMSLIVSAAVGDACEPLVPFPRTGSATAVLVTRGGCPFDVKVLNVQNAGGSLMMIEDLLDRPLQRIGGSHPLDGEAGIPSIAVSLDASRYIHQLTAEGKSISVVLEGVSSFSYSS
jgi:hypothetical protein